MLDLVKRSYEILKETVKQSGEDYTKSTLSLINEAKAVRSQISQTAQTSAETFAQIRSGNVIKKLSDWFYDKGEDYDNNSLDNEDDDFDAGFEDDTNEEGDKVPKVLDAESMKDITRGQLKAMYNIGGKQAEVNTANTAEIVSSINNRSSEMTASINNMNKTLLSISEKLDKYIEFQTQLYQSTTKQHVDEKNPLMNYDGSISLSGLFSAAKNATSDSDTVTLLSMFKDAFSMGGPDALLSSLIEISGIKDKKFIGKKGGKQYSIDDIGSFFNDAIGAATQTALSELMDSKIFQKFFPGIGTGNADMNYGDLRPNQYTTKPAVFDGVTRQSIVHIIPEYLKKINESLSGKTYDIDKRGHLSEYVNNNDDFSKITKSSFSSSGLSSNAADIIAESVQASDIDIDASDVQNASRAIMMVCVMHLHEVGKSSISMSYILANETMIIRKASETLAFASGKSKQYWSDICLSITQRLSTNIIDSTEFIKTVNKQLKTMIKEATDFAMGVQGESAGRLTFDMAEEQFRREYQSYNPSSITSDENEDDKKNDTKDNKKDNKSDNTNHVTVRPTKSSNSQKLTQLDYLRGIFNILNRGINVRVTNWDKDNTPYPKMKLIHNGNDNSDDITKTVMRQIHPSGSGNGPLHIGMQFFAQNRSSDEKSDTDKNEKDDADKKTSEKGSDDNKNDNKENKDSEGSDDDPDGENKRKINFIPESIRNLIPSMVKDNVKKLGTIITGDKVEDEDGNVKYEGGIISGVRNKVAGKVGGFKEKISNKFDDFVDEQKEKIEYKSLQNDVAKMPTDTPEAEQDKLQAQHIFALMQTSTADGETSNDISQITREINRIKDPKLKQRLQMSVTQMLKRSEKKAEEGGQKKGIFGLILSGAKKLFSPVLKVLKNIGIVIRSIGKKILTLMGKGIKSGWEDIKSGVVSMKHGLFGAKEKRDENGNIIQESSDGLLKPALNKIKTVITKSMSFLNKGFKKIIGGISSLTKKAFSALKSGFSKVTGWLVKRRDDNKQNQEPETGTKKQGLMDKFRDSEFGAGFMEAFDATKARKEAAKAKKPETYADEKANEMNQMISGAKESIFSKIVDLAVEIRDKLYDDGDSGSEDSGNNSSVSNPDDESSTTNNTSTDNLTNNESNESDSNISIPTGDSSTTPTTTSTDDGTSSDSTATSDGGSSTSGGKSGGALGSLGKLLGGALSSLLGVGKIILTLLAPLKGFDMLKQVVQSIWTNGIKPLNKIFKQIISIIKPIVKVLTEIISAIADSIATIVGIALDVVQPILEAIAPILTSLLDTLKPILDIIGVLVKIILTPLMSVVKFVITPILRQIGNSIQIQLGIVQVGFGIVMTALGGLLMGIGSIVKFLTGNSSIFDSGKSMSSMGTDMISGGINSVKQGIQGTIQLIKETAGQFSDLVNNDKSEEQEDKKSTKQETVEISGSIMDGIVGSGDGDSSIPDIYGSGNKMDQHSYGNYMNMSDHGCGPVAIADAYARRTGTKVDPAKLASKMSSLGAYDVKRGTSVSGFVNASNAMGVNVKVGGVTTASLKQATPNRPITVLGSGVGYGTRKGNNHYMNVIASDKNGGVYVSNPMSGKVQRQSIDDVVAGSQLGLYGSGDSDSDLGFSLPDSVKEAFGELAKTAGSLLSIFNFEKSTEDEVNEQLQADREEEAARQAKYTLDDDTYGKMLDEARALFEKDNPRRDGETDEEYNKRFEDSKNKYISKVSGSYMETAGTNLANSMLDGTINTTKKAAANATEIYNAGQTIQSQNSSSDSSSSGSSSGGSSSDGSGRFMSDDGKTQLMFPTGQTPKYTDTDATDADSNGFSSHSPIHEFIRMMSGRKAWTEYDGWFKYRETPKQDGEGTSGQEHKGVDIHTENDDDGMTPLYATTDGVVTVSQTSESAGNVVSWKDASGKYHTYMHLDQPSELSTNDKVEGGKTLMGYIGTTGQSTGYHLHYQISDTQWPSTIRDGVYNPLTYFKYQSPNSSGSDDETAVFGGNDREKIWTYLRTKVHMTENAAAGAMGCWNAESSNSPDTLEGYYYFDDETVENAPKSNESLNAYTERMFQLYDRDGIGHANQYYLGTDGNYYPGFGLAQWTGPRAENLLKYSRERNVYWGDLGAQLAFFANAPGEFRDRGSSLNLPQRLNAAKTPEDAATLFLDLFENQDETWHTSGVGADQNKIRREYAKEIYNQLHGYLGTKEEINTQKAVNTAKNVANAVVDKATDVKEEYIDPAWDFLKNISSKVVNTVTDKNKKSNSVLFDVVDKVVDTISPSTHGGSSGSFKTEHGGSSGTFEKDDRELFVPQISGVIGSIFGGGDSGFDISTIDDDISLDNSAISKTLYNLSNSGNKATTVVNSYKIQPNDDYQRAQLKAILTNTYSVRAERVEELLEKILEYLSKKQEPEGKQSRTSDNSVTPELFTNNEIPSQVVRLFS